MQSTQGDGPHCGGKRKGRTPTASTTIAADGVTAGRAAGTKGGSGRYRYDGAGSQGPGEPTPVVPRAKKDIPLLLGK